MAFSSRRALLACGRGLRGVLLAVPFLCYLIPYVRPIYDRIRELNEALACRICDGYLVEPTVVTECQHTFCKTVSF